MMVVSEELKTILEWQQKAYKDAVEMLHSALVDRVKKLEGETVELRISLQYSQKEVDKIKVENIAKNKEITELKKALDLTKKTNIGDEVEQLKKRVDYQEDYSRRNNIRIDGVGEHPQETWEQTQEKVQRMMRDKLNMEVVLDRAHRVGSELRHPGATPRPRTIVARFSKFTDRQQALRNSRMLKNTNIYLNEDLCESSVQARKIQLPELKRARDAGKIAYFNHVKLIVRERKEGMRNPSSSDRHVGREELLSPSTTSTSGGRQGQGNSGERRGVQDSSSVGGQAAREGGRGEVWPLPGEGAQGHSGQPALTDISAGRDLTPRTTRQNNKQINKK